MKGGRNEGIKQARKEREKEARKERMKEKEIHQIFMCQYPGVVEQSVLSCSDLYPFGTEGIPRGCD